MGPRLDCCSCCIFPWYIDLTPPPLSPFSLPDLRCCSATGEDHYDAIRTTDHKVWNNWEKQMGGGGAC